MLDWSVIFNCTYIVKKKKGVGRLGEATHYFYLMPKCCLFQWIVFSDEQIILWRKTFWLSKCEFLPLFFILRGRDTHIDFLPLFKCKALHCGWLRVLGCLIFPKCLLDLYNSKPFSFCPWMSLFPAMFCQAGISSFPPIDPVTVFDAILTSKQTCEKLQYLYKNLLSNNFGKTAVLKKILIVN